MCYRANSNNFISLQSEKKGLLAEWLGAGLQNRLLRFESGRDLSIKYLLWYLMWGKSDLRTFVRRFFCGILPRSHKDTKYFFRELRRLTRINFFPQHVLLAPIGIHLYLSAILTATGSQADLR